MTSAPPRAVVRVAVGCFLTVLVTVVVGAPALAHDQLVDSFPAAGEHLATAPSQVRLDFTDDVLTIGAAVVVVDGAGRTWSSGEPVVDGTSVTLPVDPDLPDGAYEVRWRVVSSDGHVIADAVPFTVGDVTSPAPAAPGSEDDAATSPAEVADGERDGGPPSTGWRTAAVAAVGAAAGLGLYGALLVVRRRNDRGTPGAGGAST